MAKPAVQFACTECGYASGRWFGSAPAAPRSARSSRRSSGRSPRPKAPPKPLLRLVDVQVEEAKRISTGVPELDRVLGGGLVPASLVLVGGEPGVGKSTLLLTALAGDERDAARRCSSRARSRSRRSSCAPSGSAAPRTSRSSPRPSSTSSARRSRPERPDVCVIDSIQTLYSAELGSAPGLRRPGARGARRACCASRRSAGVATILVGHVTKDGTVAGPRVLEHLVDCVLQFEGDRYHAHRVLRATKNRFGSTNELGVFEMTGAGLVGVPDPSELFGRTVDGRARRRGRVRARGDAADPARDPGARRADAISRCRAASPPASTRSGSR